MIGNERRQGPRTTLEKLTYINIEPNNGGIVLNVSEEGLCFHSVAPVQRNSGLRLWFPGSNHRMEIRGELVWTDEKQTVGGIRFNTVPRETREQIQGWIRELRTSHAFLDNKAPTPSASPPQAVPAFTPPQPDAEVSSAAFAPARSKALPRKVIVRIPKGFSAGLATGLLVSVLVSIAFWFHTYRRQFGESLIRLGEQLAAKHQVQSPTEPTVLGNIAPATRAEPAAHPAIRTAKPDKLLSSAASPTTPERGKLEPTPATAISATDGSAVKFPTDATAAPSTSPAAPLPPIAGLSDSKLTLNRLGTLSTLQPVEPPGEYIEKSETASVGSNPQMYFEVGKFKQEFLAHETMEKLGQLGFPTTMMGKGRLWMNSYYVLVGPYWHDADAEAAHKNLLARGFTPRAFERGSRNFTFRSRLTLQGTQIPAGDCTISWESYVTDAKVKFLQRGYTVASAGGRWVKRGFTYENDALVYRKNADKSRTLLEIQFAGMSRVLIFGKAS